MKKLTQKHEKDGSEKFIKLIPFRSINLGNSEKSIKGKTN